MSKRGRESPEEETKGLSDTSCRFRRKDDVDSVAGPSGACDAPEADDVAERNRVPTICPTSVKPAPEWGPHSSLIGL
jgi:ABC-type branched-subunit amino acid transport system substrate-binding protein